MQKVRKLVTTIMIAALITAMEGTTISQLSHYVKADTNTTSQTSQAENDLTQYKKNQWNWRQHGSRGRFFPLSIAKKCVEKSLEKLQRNRSFQCV